MEETEDPTEMVREHLSHEAEHTHDKWMSQVALSSAIVAVLAAVSALFSGHHANEAMRDQIHSSDKWAYYQAKGIKALILGSKATVNEGDTEKIAEYKKEQEEISREARELEEASEKRMNAHLVFARAVTLFQISIAVSAIGALTRRRRYWYLGLGFSATGLVFFLLGLLK